MDRPCTAVVLVGGPGPHRTYADRDEASLWDQHTMDFLPPLAEVLKVVRD